MITATRNFVYGTKNPSAPAFVAPASGLTRLAAAERLAGFVSAHDALSVELAGARGRLNRAAVYLANPACNPALALANLERLRAKHSEVLTRLRANRLAARSFMKSLDDDRAG